MSAALALRGLKLCVVDVCERRVLHRVKALRDLFGLLKLAQLDVRATEPEEHQVGDEAVGMRLEKVAEDGGRLIVLAFGEERATAVERILLGLSGRVVLLRSHGRGRGDGGCEGGKHEHSGQRCCAESIPRNQSFILRRAGASLNELFDLMTCRRASDFLKICSERVG